MSTTPPEDPTVPETDPSPPVHPLIAKTPVEERDLTEDVEHPLEEEDSDERIIEKLQAQGVRLGRFHVAPAVFWPSLIVVLAVVAVAVLFPGGTDEVLQAIQGGIVANLGWYYMMAVAVFIIFSLVVCFSKYGTIRLGKDDEKPDFGVLTWFCMLFAAGMGIGLVFYGVGEPLGYVTSAVKPGWEGDQAELAQLAMAQTYVHWGLHPWAIYAVIGLALAYSIHRRGRPVSIRWALEPLLGHRVKGWMGDLIDIVAIFGTLAGVATSLGLGVQQIGEGLRQIGIVEQTDNTLLVTLIVIITFIATLSVVSGLGKGIKWLSNTNLSLAGIVLLTVLLLGPTVFLFQNFIQSIGAYLANFMGMTFDVGAFEGQEGQDWASAWTLFYWGWWISWAPFVGVFIARISRGRTVREFIAGVLLVPSLVGFFWFAVMGGSDLFRQLYTDDPLVVEGEDVAVEGALFEILGDLSIGPVSVGGVMSVAAIFLIAIFFVTSSDSGSLVIDMLASGGHPNPPLWSRIMFSLLEGAVAIALLLAGGLQAIQAAALATALPFSLILLAMAVTTLRSLKADQAERDRQSLRERYELFSGSLVRDDEFGRTIDHRVDSRTDYTIGRTRGVFDKGGVRGTGRRGKGGAHAAPAPSAGTAPSAEPPPSADER
ncbi:BCCT family transporter [Brachybacterium aquaticum]|uniref:Choline/glycine/proline betaine transport protein n=1 Tax=Brachybacterium aquaticum TaxID=1432564 RepID=A0A841AFL9_9MICO|nr:BCCT family transporter [Brachybacterium aquaticum]MBB5832401.1 choline/glycine/proline betaine transport protein [Brachybacterium aquaticum]